MRIYLMRHAEAVEPSAWPEADRTRPLSPAGRLSLAAAVEHMRRLKLSADLLLTSPFARALQTSEAIAENLHVLQMIPCEELSAGARLDAFLKLVERHAGEPSLWFVTHMPEICMFASRATGVAKILEQPFRPAEVLAADCEIRDGAIVSGRLLWRRRVEDWPTASA